MMKSLIQILAEQLAQKYPNLSRAEAEVIAHAFFMKGNQLSADFPGMPLPPKGYFDCRVGCSYLPATNGNLRTICEHLRGDFLQEHPTSKGLFTIAEEMCPICDALLKEVPGLPW